MKELYVILYVGLNKMVQYLRDIIELKNQRKSFVVIFKSNHLANFRLPRNFDHHQLLRRQNIPMAS